MSLVELLASPTGRLATATLLHFVWQGAAVTVVLVAAVELFRIRSAGGRYAASLAALIVMILCPVATFGWLCAAAPGSGATRPPAATEPAMDAGATMDNTATLSPFAPQKDVLSLSESRLSACARLQPYALAGWLVGVTLFAARLLIGAVAALRLRRERIALPLELASRVEKLGRRMRIEALPLVFLSRQVSDALAVGLVRPLVLVPAAWATELPAAMLEAVIAHELAHLRRRDLWINLVQRIAETLLFYHPAVWWLSRRLRIERELCADEMAVAATGQRLVYVQALEQVAHRRRAEVRPLLAAFMRGGKNMRLLERIKNVLGSRGGERSRLWPAGVVALALPLGLWAASLGLSTATADDDKKEAEQRVEVKFFAKAQEDEREDDAPREREGDRNREVDREREGDRPREREGDRPREGDREREGDRRRDGEARDRERGPRDGEGPPRPGPRDGDFRREGARGPRDGEGPPRPGPRDGDFRRERFPGGPSDGEFRPGFRGGFAPPRFPGAGPEFRGPEAMRQREAARIEELTMMVRRLTEQVERLQAELNELRGRREGGREGGERREESRFEKRPLDEAALRERKERDVARHEELLRLRKERAAAEQDEAAIRAEKERRAAELKEAAAREGLDKEALIQRQRERAEQQKLQALKARDADEERVKALRARLEKERAAVEEKKEKKNEGDAVKP